MLSMQPRGTQNNTHAANSTVHEAQRQDYPTCYNILQGQGSDNTDTSHAN